MGDEFKKNTSIQMALIAPCGMNCRLCRAYMRDKMPCPGCRGDDRFKTKVRITCSIKTCEKRAIAGDKYCSSCDELPCARLEHLDKRYETKYGMSMISNLVNIRELGIRQFIRTEKKKWTCPGCGGLLCVHHAQCVYCQHRWR